MNEKKQESYIDRMNNEYQELSERLDKALAFIDSESLTNYLTRQRVCLKYRQKQ